MLKGINAGLNFEIATPESHDEDHDLIEEAGLGGIDRISNLEP
jgi:hypothetical protein